MREASASEPLMTCRKRIRRCQNRGVATPPGSATETAQAGRCRHPHPWGHPARVPRGTIFLPRKSWWSTTNERSTITTALPHRLATWIGLRSQIHSVATRERRWFASLSPRWGKHFHTGSSTSSTAWSHPAFDQLRLAVLPLCPLPDRVETVPRNDVVSSRQLQQRK